VKGYRSASYGDGFADVYDDWYPAGPEVDAMVVALAGLAAGGPVLELGCGTGRIALPLAQRSGLAVVGLDASPAMLSRLRAKAGAEAVTAVEGDMADFDLAPHGPFALVFAAFNTFFNLATPTAQRGCLDAVRRHLGPGGRLALECFVPGQPPPGERDTIELRTLEVDRVVLRISRLDPQGQTVSGQHVELAQGQAVRLRPWHLRFASPAELDGLAASAGLELEQRWADWSGAPFTEHATQHVSIYRVAAARP
jgi:SAM-dependent methyltransferase